MSENQCTCLETNMGQAGLGKLSFKIKVKRKATAHSGGRKNSTQPHVLRFHPLLSETVTSPYLCQAQPLGTTAAPGSKGRVGIAERGRALLGTP